MCYFLVKGWLKGRDWDLIPAGEIPNNPGFAICLHCRPNVLECWWIPALVVCSMQPWLESSPSALYINYLWVFGVGRVLSTIEQEHPRTGLELENVRILVLDRAVLFIRPGCSVL